MTMIYGHKWTSTYGEIDDGTWLKGLADMTPENLGTGLAACLGRDDPWPPTLPEFRKLSRPIVVPYHQRAPLLDAPVNKSQVAIREIEKMKEITGIS